MPLAAGRGGGKVRRLGGDGPGHVGRKTAEPGSRDLCLAEVGRRLTPGREPGLTLGPGAVREARLL